MIIRFLSGTSRCIRGCRFFSTPGMSVIYTVEVRNGGYRASKAAKGWTCKLQ